MTFKRMKTNLVRSSSGQDNMSVKMSAVGVTV